MTAVVKSKSNISNNRAASPIGDSPSGPWDAVVLCCSGTFPGLPEQGHLLLMDNQTGEIFAYSDAAVVGNADPVHVGTLTAVGKRIIKPGKKP